MTRFALDPRTLIYLADHRCPLEGGHSLVAPHSIRPDALEILLERVRRGALAERDALAQHQWMTAVKMRQLGDRVTRGTAWRLACERGVSLREAEYISVAQLQAEALIALDPTLVTAARDVVDLAQVGEICAHGRDERPLDE